MVSLQSGSMVQNSVLQQNSFSMQFQEFHVNSTTGSNTGDGSVSQPFQTITHALQQVSLGSTAIIRLAEGQYSNQTGEVFPLVVPAQTSVLGTLPRKGANSSSSLPETTEVTILIQGGGQYESPTFGEQNVAIVLQPNALIRDVSICNPHPSGTGVWIEEGPAAITHCRVLGCEREGILVTGTANPVITDCLLQHNKASGITFTRDSRGEVRRSVGRENRFGMVIGDRAAPFIVDNQFIENQSGLVLSGMACPVLRQNQILQNHEAGLSVFQQAQPDLGQPSDPGGNVFRQNGTVELRNATSTQLGSVGNQLDFLGIQGSVDLRASHPSVSAVSAVSPSSSSSQALLRFLFPRRHHSFTEKLCPVVPPLPDSQTVYVASPPDTQGHWVEPFLQGLQEYKAIVPSDQPFQPDAFLTRSEFDSWMSQILADDPATDDPATDDPATDNLTTSNPSDLAKEDLSTDLPTTDPAAVEELALEKPASEPSLLRVQAILMVVKHLGLKGENPDELAPYRDRFQIPNTVVPFVAAAIQHRLIVLQAEPGYFTSDIALPAQYDRLIPLSPITRAEAIALLYQALVHQKRAKPIASSHLVHSTGQSIAFSDSSHHWAADFIRGMVSKGIMAGIGGQFLPDQPLTRAEYAVLLMRQFEPLPDRPARTFTDVDEVCPEQKQAIERVYQAKLMGGFADGTFRPTQPVSRLQVLVSLVSALKCPAAEWEILDRYADRDQIPESARPAVATATAHWLVVNHPKLSQLQPNRAATRAEVAAALYQANVYLGRSVPLPCRFLIHPCQPNQSQQFKTPIVVAIDPGHGGLDFGMVCMKPRKDEAPQPFAESSGFGSGVQFRSPSTSPARFEYGQPQYGQPPGPFPGVAPGLLPERATERSPEPLPELPPELLPGRLPPIPTQLDQLPLREKEIVLPIAQQVAQHLELNGIQAILTRSDDRYLDPAARANLIHQVNADLLISIHVNGAPNHPEINGLETYHFSSIYNPNANESAQLAHTVHAAILEAIDLPDRGIHEANFHLLRLVSVPAIHLEVGYLTGNLDAENLLNRGYCAQFAKAIATGIFRHIRQLV
jgi:N-acetylmuramoyl-L-alanine amidase